MNTLKNIISGVNNEASNIVNGNPSSKKRDRSKLGNDEVNEMSNSSKLKVVDVADSANKVTQGAINQVIGNTKNIFGKVTDSIDISGGINAVTENISGAIVGDIAGVVNEVAQGAVDQAIGGAADVVNQIIHDIDISNGINDVTENISGAINDVVDSANEVAQGAVDQAIGGVADVVNEVAQGVVDQAIGGAMDVVNEVTQGVNIPNLIEGSDSNRILRFPEDVKVPSIPGEETVGGFVDGLAGNSSNNKKKSKNKSKKTRSKGKGSKSMQIDGVKGGNIGNNPIVNPLELVTDNIVNQLDGSLLTETSDIRRFIDIWDKGQEVPFMALANTFTLIQQTRSILRNILVLREFFRIVIEKTPEDLINSIYLCLNRLGTQAETSQLGIGDFIIQKAVSLATGISINTIKSEYKKLGDLGLVAESFNKRVKTLVKPRTLTIRSLFKILLALSMERGTNSRNRRIEQIRNLLVSCRGSESLFIIRAIQGKLRINLGPKSIITGLAHAFAINDPGSIPIDCAMRVSKERFLEAFNQCPDWNIIIPKVFENGWLNIHNECRVTEGIPIEPMLAQPINRIETLSGRLSPDNKFIGEFKYDGERAQIHRLSDGQVRIFSRNLEDNTERFPDVIQNLNQFIRDENLTKSFILDCEIVAYDRSQGKILPYQILSTRSRKNVNINSIKVQVCTFVFDLLSLNGESLIALQLEQRKRLIEKHFRSVEGFFRIIEFRIFNEIDNIEPYLLESIENQCEGLMLKTFVNNATYQPAKRTISWFKFKKDYLEDVADSVDLVPIGAWYGKGKRSGNFGAFLLACYNPDTEEFESVCKIGTGFTDNDLRNSTELLERSIIDMKPSFYLTSLKPDIWLDSVAVWEVRVADLTISNKHMGGSTLTNGKGIGLRFPRFLRVRDDKTPESATSSTEILNMYQLQKNIASLMP